MELDQDLVKSLVRMVMRESNDKPASTPTLDTPDVQQALQATLSQPELQRVLLAEAIQATQTDKLRKALAKEAVQLDILQRLNPNAAGLDIGAAEIWACVPEGRAPTLEFAGQEERCPDCQWIQQLHG